MQWLASGDWWRVEADLRHLVKVGVLAIVLAGCAESDKPTLPQVGSCCSLDGTCVVATQEGCAGNWTQGGVCDPNPCQQPTGSCCAEDGACTVTLQDSCAGSWTMAAACDPNPCEQRIGSCCYADGTCAVTTGVACSGTWTWNGTCDPNPCPQPVGSCCYETGRCYILARGNCLGLGTWTEGGVCDPNPCPQPTGSCCLSDASCTVTAEAECSGYWIMLGTCDPNPCVLPPPVGMILIPAGTFTMGSPSDEFGRRSGETRHEVIITQALEVCAHEVTQAEWYAVEHWNDSAPKTPYRPVENVTWFDCLKYCNDRSIAEGLTPVYTYEVKSVSGHSISDATVEEPNWNANGYRLLTEAEWEYACRAGTTSAFCSGGSTVAGCGLDPNLDQVGWYCGNCPNGAFHDVMTKLANPWGLYDMHGNVLEWCWDWYDSYQADPVTDPRGPASGSRRVARGGCWDNYMQYCRSASRYPLFPDNHFALGLRVARAAP